MIDDNILAMVLDTTDDNEMTLGEMILQATDQPIEKSQVIIGKDENDEDVINRFSAWTRDYILILLLTSVGYHLLKHDRNYSSD